jgi:hypothetical protein
VAIRVLPDLVAKDEARLRRFAQEARAISALNHPNILSIHDIGASAGTNYIVTELLEGGTLREKLGNGRLPPRRATEYAIQITRVLGGSPESEVVYVSPDALAIPQQTSQEILRVLKLNIEKVNIVTGRRQPFVTVSPSDSAGIIGLDRPHFTADGKLYVFNQYRDLSVLYLAAGLK